MRKVIEKIYVDCFLVSISVNSLCENWCTSQRDAYVWLVESNENKAEEIGAGRKIGHGVRNVNRSRK